MKKVKITVLKTTLDEELAKEYGAAGLTACPMLEEGQVFYADYAMPGRMAFATRHGRQFINMCLRWHTALTQMFFIMETGSANRVWRSAAATTAYGR